MEKNDSAPQAESSAPAAPSAPSAGAPAAPPAEQQFQRRGLAFTPAQNRLATAAISTVAFSVMVLFASALVWLLVRFLGWVSSAVVPLLSALALSVLFRPFYNFMLKPLRNPALTVIAMMAIVIAPVTVVSVNYGPKIVNQIANFASSMPDLVAKTGRWVKDSHPEIVSLADSIGAPDGVRLFLADPEKYARELSAGDIVGKGGSAVQYGRSAANVARGLFSALLTIIFFVCFITMPPVTGRKVVGYLPMLKPATADFIAEQFDRFCDIVSGFFCRQVFICLLEGCLYGAGFRWVAHLPHGFLIGFMLGALNIVPFFGSAVGLAVALPLAVLGADGSSTRAILVLAVWGAGQILDGWVITPVIQGGKTKLSYPAIIFSFLFWGTVFNTFLGMLLAIPMSAFCKVLWDSLRTKIKGFI